jgi:hypothetical protein
VPGTWSPHRGFREEALITKEKHLVDETGRVFCAIRARDVDVERCLACERLEDYDLDSRRPFVACRAIEFAQRSRPIEGA